MERPQERDDGGTGTLGGAQVRSIVQPRRGGRHRGCAHRGSSTVLAVSHERTWPQAVSTALQVSEDAVQPFRPSHRCLPAGGRPRARAAQHRPVGGLAHGDQRSRPRAHRLGVWPWTRRRRWRQGGRQRRGATPRWRHPHHLARRWRRTSPERCELSPRPPPHREQGVGTRTPCPGLAGAPDHAETEPPPTPTRGPPRRAARDRDTRCLARGAPRRPLRGATAPGCPTRGLLARRELGVDEVVGGVGIVVIGGEPSRPEDGAAELGGLWHFPRDRRLLLQVVQGDHGLDEG